MPIHFTAPVQGRDEEVEFGLVSFIKLEGANHYVTYCRTEVDSWILYDDANEPTAVDGISVDGWIILPVQIAVYLPKPIMA
jgi:hypothetical protein